MKNTEDIVARLHEMGISCEQYHHDPVVRVSDRHEMGLTFDARLCKNLLVTTRTESSFFLLMLPEDASADLRAFARAAGVSRLQFASAQRLEEFLGQAPGCAGVLGAINDSAHVVEIVFDVSLRGCPRVATHPSDNCQTLVMPFAGLERYVRACGSRIRFYDFSGAAK